MKQTEKSKVKKETTEIIEKNLNSEYKKSDLKGISQSSHQFYVE